MRIRNAWLVALAIPALAQQQLSLQQAVETALHSHPAITAAAEQIKAADSRVEQARSGYLPKVNYQESFTRSNNPVFVFSSLLTQRQFTEQNFAIPTLNRPDFLNNFQSLVSVDQTLWDNRATKHQVRMAELGRTVSAEDERRARLNTMVRVIETYFAAQLAQASLATASESVKSAEADVERAETVRDAGMSTEADVLSIRVHLATVREQQIRRSADLTVALAALNEALGLPLDTKHELTTSLEPAQILAPTVGQYEEAALKERPEIRQIRLSAELAETQSLLARSAYWPQVGVRGAFEADRQQFVSKGGANWTLGAFLRWNLFNGYYDRAKISEAAHQVAAARAEERRMNAGMRLEVRRALANYQAAGERLRVTDETVAQAAEALRITKNRYDAGMAPVTDLLRNETALLDARTRRLGAILEQRLAGAALELAAGTLSPTSEVLQ
jgi:outer membrane protein TolC